MPISADDRPRHWYAIRMAPKAENSIIAALQDAGLAGWLPIETRWRGSGANRTKVRVPAFAGYAFCSLPEPVAGHFGAVLNIDGVRGFLGGAQPEAVSPLAISVLQRRQAFGHFDLTRNWPPRTVHESPSDRRAVDRLVARLDQKAVAA
jgi:hypothetical protein